MSQQNTANMNNMFPSAAAMRVNEEIKRLQQIQQRMRAATCPGFTSSAGGGLLSSNMQSGGFQSAENQSGALPFNSRPMLASFLQQQQQQQQQQQEETRRLMLLDQLRFTMPGPGAQAPANRASLFNDVSLPPPSSLAQQQQAHQDTRSMMRVGTIEPFPEKLMRMLTEVESCGRGDVISFINNGTGFAIHKPDTFFKEIVPLYFRHSRLSSFKRQLNLYGFEQINIGPYRGGYYHEQFQRDRPEICRRMRRVAVKVAGAKKMKAAKKQEDGEKPKEEEHKEVEK